MKLEPGVTDFNSMSKLRGRILSGLLVSTTIYLGSLGMNPIEEAHAHADCQPPQTAQANTINSLTSSTSNIKGESLETTEYLPDGAYQVSRCNKDGTLQVSMNVAPISLGGIQGYLATDITHQSGGAFTTTFITYPDPSGPTFLSFWNSNRGVRARSMVIPPTDRDLLTVPTSDETPPRVTDDGCSNGNYKLFPFKWDLRDRKFRVYHMPSLQFQDAVINGGLSWSNTTNDCGFPDQNNFTFKFNGRSKNRPSRDFDFSNVIAYGNVEMMGCPLGATACTRIHYYDDTHIFECDTVLSSEENWSFDGAPGTDDVWSIMAHEFGHWLGLDHPGLADSDRWLTMYLFAIRGDISHRTLGYGDTLGMRAIYPG